MTLGTDPKKTFWPPKNRSEKRLQKVTRRLYVQSAYGPYYSTTSASQLDLWREISAQLGAGEIALGFTDSDSGTQQLALQRQNGLFWKNQGLQRTVCVLFCLFEESLALKSNQTTPLVVCGNVFIGGILEGPAFVWSKGHFFFSFRERWGFCEIGAWQFTNTLNTRSLNNQKRGFRRPYHCFCAFSFKKHVAKEHGCCTWSWFKFGTTPDKYLRFSIWANTFLTRPHFFQGRIFF